jgi:hypothetical protein
MHFAISRGPDQRNEILKWDIFVKSKHLFENVGARPEVTTGSHARPEVKCPLKSARLNTEVEKGKQKMFKWAVNKRLRVQTTKNKILKTGERANGQHNVDLNHTLLIQSVDSVAKTRHVSREQTSHHGQESNGNKCSTNIYFIYLVLSVNSKK